MANPVPKTNKMATTGLNVVNIIVTLIALGVGRAYPVPTGIFALLYFAVVLGITINKLNTAKAQSQDTSKLTREARGYAIWLVFIVAILGMNVWLLGGFKAKTIAQQAYQSPTDLASQAAQEAKSSTTFPYQVDSVTSMTDITSSGNTIQYHYQIKGADTSNLTSDSLRNMVKPNACSNTDTKNILTAGVNLQYTYTVYETGKVYDFTLASADCQ